MKFPHSIFAVGAVVLVALMLNACVNEPAAITFTCAQPQVARTSPASGDTGVSLNPLITATFRTRMDSSSFTPGSVVLLLGFDTIPGTLSYVPADTTVRFIPSDTLLPDTTYTVVISRDVRDTAGTPMGSSYLWIFTTADSAGGGSGPTLDTIPDTPILLSPAHLSTGVLAVITPFSWNPSARAQTYRLQISTDSLFTTPVFDAAGISGTSQLVAGLLPFNTYYWRVNATNTAGASPWSLVWRFSTLP